MQAATSLVALASLLACGQGSGLLPSPVARTLQGPAIRTAPVAIATGPVTGDAPLVRSFTVPQSGEGLLELKASVPGSDWESVGREAATVRLSVDGHYNQDIVLFEGESSFVYRRLLGHLEPGEHTLEIERLAKFSAPGLLRVDVEGGAVSVVPQESADYDTMAHAPILYSRPDAHRTDTPLAVFYERQAGPDGGSLLKYTTIVSNEDGGTATPALMARWGRTVDIDWSYRLRRDAQGHPVEEKYQGWLHFVRNFEGAYEGEHPLLQVASSNNIYSDDLDGPLRLRLVPDERLDDTATAREDLLDRLPWIYQLSAKELFREHKAAKDFYTPKPQGGSDMIGDPRRFLTLEFQQTGGYRGVGIEVKLKNYPEPFVSHRGDSGLTAKRSGWCRVSVELPRPVSVEDIERIDMVGPGRWGSTTVTRVRKVLTLNKDFQPVFMPITWEGEGHLHGGDDRVTVYTTEPVKQ